MDFVVPIPPDRVPQQNPEQQRKHSLGKSRQVVWDICKMFGKNPPSIKKNPNKMRKHKPTFILVYQPHYVKTVSEHAFNLWRSSIKHRSYFSRASLHSIPTITRFNQFHRNVTCQRSSYSIPVQKHYSNF